MKYDRVMQPLAIAGAIGLVIGFLIEVVRTALTF